VIGKHLDLAKVVTSLDNLFQRVCVNGHAVAQSGASGDDGNSLK
jgi:hypothetical protein